MVLRRTIANRRKSADAGLTLVEVLVAITILGLSLLALAPMFTSAVRTNAAANQLTSANTLARDKLEELAGYPRSDPRLNVPPNANASGPSGGTPPVGSTYLPNSPWCNNDLPLWHKPSTGQTSGAATSPGPGWFQYPYTRTYTIEQFDGTLTARILSPNPYVVKLVTVTVQPRRGPFPGLRRTTQSLYLRVRDAF